MYGAISGGSSKSLRIKSVSCFFQYPCGTRQIASCQAAGLFFEEQGNCNIHIIKFKHIVSCVLFEGQLLTRLFFFEYISSRLACIYNQKKQTRGFYLPSGLEFDSVPPSMTQEPNQTLRSRVTSTPLQHVQW